MFKEMLITFGVVLVALIVFNILAKKFPALTGSSWEEETA